MKRVYLFSRHAGEPVKVGVWQVDDDDIGRFQYQDDWLTRADAFPLDPVHLPLQSDIYETARKRGIFAVFEDAGPDQWGERVLAHEHPARDLGLVEKLLYASGRGVGCLLFSASRERPKPVSAPVDWHSLTQAQEGVDRLIAGEVVSEELMHLLEPGSGLGGARPKISVTRDGRLWLAKFPRQDDTYDVPRTEFATMQLARRAGIDTPDVELVALPDGRAVYLIERFDQRDGTAHHYVSANTLLGIDRVREDDAFASMRRQTRSATCRRNCIGAWCSTYWCGTPMTTCATTAYSSTSPAFVYPLRLILCRSCDLGMSTRSASVLAAIVAAWKIVVGMPPDSH